MFKTVAKIIATLMITIVFVFILNQAYLAYLSYSNESYAQMPSKIRFANTGSSHGVHAFDYSQTTVSAFNFAFDSQSIVYDEQLIDYYMDRFEEGATIVIPISYFTFWDQEMEADEFQAKNVRYLGILDTEHMRFQTKRDYLVTKYFAIVDFADLQERTLIKRKEAEVKNPETGDYSLEEVGRLRAAYHLKGMMTEGKVLPIEEKNVVALEHLIENCQQHQVTPILVTTPYLTEYSKWFPNEFRKVFYGEIDRICKAYEIEYWDFSEEESFYQSPNLFQDTDHLNSKGAKLFTKKILERCGIE